MKTAATTKVDSGSPDAADQALPHRIVALGGGTGLPAVLRGLRTFVPGSDGQSLTAVVTVSDDGGSSGRLRRAMGVPAPGDIRNCLVALSADEHLLAALFQHRYSASAELEGHSLGNLILAALTEQTGCFGRAVELSSRVLRTVGRILPVTRETVTLEALLDDGTRVQGETAINRCGKKIHRVLLKPKDCEPTPGVIESILQADLVVLGPGSLHTSVLPNIVVDGVGAALQQTRGLVVLVANLVSERGEAAGLSLADHVSVIEEHAGRAVVDAVLVNNQPVDATILARYRSEGATPLDWPQGVRHRVHVERRGLLAPGIKLRHDASATATGLIETWRAHHVRSTAGAGS